MKSALLGVAFVTGLVGLHALGAAGHAASPAWAMNASVIEACSCTMFCQCYFNPRPTEHTDATEHAGHGKGHFCKFNNAYRVNKGHHGATKLDGVTFWLAGDLGAEFSDGEMDWSVLHFEPEASKAQRDGVTDILGHLFPVRWKSFEIGKDAPIEWSATRDRAVARLDGGKGGEVVLKGFKGDGDQPVVIKNLKYWGASRNDGFVMMPNEVEAYRLGPKAYEYKGTNGFMITIDIDANTAPPKAKTSM
ncbi:MAG: DUF1326 domain-containing protein [Vicinamibacteria bacterium]|nr:DUF1326 domain-containing protein [Vicinamibacteria bacterium]